MLSLWAARRLPMRDSAISMLTADRDDEPAEPSRAEPKER
jgi:hypothetical protein